MRVLPDGLTGAIMAVEGIADATVLLHGPGGCRVRHMVVSDAVFHRDVDFGDSPYYCGYSQVPATYLDEYDYINGAACKAEEALMDIGRTSPRLVVVIESPGASLIGDDLHSAIADNGMAGTTFVMTDPLSSVPVTRAIDRTLKSVMDFIDPPPRQTKKGTVNILGLSIMDKDWRSARDELSGIIGDIGLEVVCMPGAGSSVSQLINSVNAEFNIVVCPEMCGELMQWYSSRGVPSIVSDAGAPVGFDATEAWIAALASASGRDPHPALERVRRCRSNIAERFLGMRYNALRIRGLTFSVAAPASVARPLTEWLFGYLAMAPEAVKVDDGSDERQAEQLEFFLESNGFGYSWNREPSECGVVLCEGITATEMALDDRCRIGIPIGFSSMGLDDILPRPIYGVAGAMYILDELLHGVRGS